MRDGINGSSSGFDEEPIAGPYLPEKDRKGDEKYNRQQKADNPKATWRKIFGYRGNNKQTKRIR
jgi:hypothetical protein